MKAGIRLEVRGNTRAELEKAAHEKAADFFGPGIGYELGDYSAGKTYDNINSLYATIYAKETEARPATGPGTLTCGRCHMVFPVTHSHYCTSASSHTYPK